MFFKFIFFLALFFLVTSVSFSQKTKTFQSATGKYGLLSKKGDTLVQPLYDNIYDFDKNGLAFFRLNKKFGVMDKTGKQIIKPNYDYIRRYSQYFIVFQGERKYYTEKGIYGLLNADGSELLPLSFQKMEVWNNHLLLIKDEKHGVLNSKGQFSVPLVYDFMQTNFYSKYLKVAINGLHGYIDASNKEVIPIEFVSVSQVYNKKVIVKKDGKYGMMAVGGKWTIDLQFEELNFASEGLSLAKLSGKYGYVDKNGKMVLDFIYDDAYDFNNHYTVAQDDKSLFLIDKKGKRFLVGNYDYIENDYSDYILVARDFPDSVGKISQRFGLLNTNLEEITPTIYDQIEVMELEDFGFANVVRDKKFGLLNAQGNNFLPTDYDEFINVEGFDYTGLVMIKKDGKFGLVKSDGTLQLTVIYDFIDFDMAVDDGFGDIILNGKYGFIDNEGNIKSRRWYDEISLDYLQYYDMAPVRKDGKYGIVDKEGKIVFPVIFDYMPDIETIIERSSAIFLRSNSKFGVYSVEGEELVAPKYDFITDEGGDFVNYFLIENDKKRGLLDKNFVEIVPCKYAHIEILSLEKGDDFAVVSLNKKMGLIDKSGKEILPCEYNILEVISSEDEGVIEVLKNGRTYQINKFGKEINSPE